jgi:hypothetical protein
MIKDKSLVYNFSTIDFDPVLSKKLAYEVRARVEDADKV